MNESIYAPPEADIEVRGNADGDYYVVAPGKFLALTILTMGLYLFYWFYRQWRSVKQRDESGIWPIPRGIFYIFFTHSLFSDISGKLRDKGISHAWSPGTAATLIVVVVLLSSILSQLSSRNIGSPITDVASLAAVPVLAFLALFAQKAANVASGDASGSGNADFTGANWVWMILGGLFWALTLFGLYFIITEPELFVDP